MNTINPQLTLYYFAACPFCQVVLDVVEQLNLQIKLKDTMAQSEYRNELVTLTGRTQVPCLTVDGEVMLESADIKRWLLQNQETLTKN